MMTIFMSVSLMTSMMIMMTKHPLAMGFTLLLQTSVTAAMSSNFNMNSWFSYIMFLILIGGMMVLFMYMTSIASNEKFKNLKSKHTMIIIPAMIITMVTTPYLIEKTSETFQMNQFPHNNLMMNKFITFPLMMILTSTMLYLLMALIASVKITELNKGPLRQMN